MQYVSFRHDGAESYGVLSDGAVVDARLVSDRFPPSLRTLLSTATGEAVAALSSHDPHYRLDDVDLLPVITEPSKILCIGLNYVAHRKEAGRPAIGYPTVFPRFADTQIGHGQPLIRPGASECLDYEGELAVVIGKACYEVGQADALDYVAGYACYNDFSVRDWQRHSSQWTAGKNFPGTGAFGPALVTPDEVGNPAGLTLTTRVNGEPRQSASTAEMIFSVSQLIAYISSFTPLTAGDVIVTGTPAGVGDRRDPPVYLRPGDVVEVEISRVGVLRNTVS
jgi:2-keto-4-pentenoate hydratase/2-oxohepta-3-ene-1,7-dioic acid hydratase in catechol pathway